MAGEPACSSLQQQPASRQGPPAGGGRGGPGSNAAAGRGLDLGGGRVLALRPVSPSVCTVGARLRLVHDA
eukprot:COSAG01_NODE_138_length_24329_cov_45.428229_18_plen_69_part_01